MDRLFKIVRQLPEPDFQSLHQSLTQNKADKSSVFLKNARDKNYSDAQMMQELNITPGAYYTLKSRLNQKVEDFLLSKMEGTKMELLRKVSNLPDLVFNHTKEIAHATLRKLEKNLQDYDMPYELISAYKAMKKIHLHTPEHYEYSQLYNKHVAYTLAIDKAEDLTADFFKVYGEYLMTKEKNKTEHLVLLKQELDNVANLYKSHRLYVYQAIVNIFFRLFVPFKDEFAHEAEDTEDIFRKTDEIFKQYESDLLYRHLKIVFDYLKFEHYLHTGSKKAEQYYREVNYNLNGFLSRFNPYIFPAQFLLSKIKYAQQNEREAELYAENKTLFRDYESEPQHISAYFVWSEYSAYCCYAVRKYDEGVRHLLHLQNEINLKDFPHADIEIKLFSALLYCLKNERDLCMQLVNSVKRQTKDASEGEYENVKVFLKIISTSLSDVESVKENKLKSLAEKFNALNKGERAILEFLKADDTFIKRLLPVVKN